MSVANVTFPTSHLNDATFLLKKCFCSSNIFATIEKKWNKKMFTSFQKLFLQFLLNIPSDLLHT